MDLQLRGAPRGHRGDARHRPGDGGGVPGRGAAVAFCARTEDDATDLDRMIGTESSPSPWGISDREVSPVALLVGAITRHRMGVDDPYSGRRRQVLAALDDDGAVTLTALAAARSQGVPRPVEDLGQRCSRPRQAALQQLLAAHDLAHGRVQAGIEALERSLELADATTARTRLTDATGPWRADEVDDPELLRGDVACALVLPTSDPGHRMRWSTWSRRPRASACAACPRARCPCAAVPAHRRDVAARAGRRGQRTGRARHPPDDRAPRGGGVGDRSAPRPGRAPVRMTVGRRCDVSWVCSAGRSGDLQREDTPWASCRT